MKFQFIAFFYTCGHWTSIRVVKNFHFFFFFFPPSRSSDLVLTPWYPYFTGVRVVPSLFNILVPLIWVSPILILVTKLVFYGKCTIDSLQSQAERSFLKLFGGIKKVASGILVVYYSKNWIEKKVNDKWNAINFFSRVLLLWTDSKGSIWRNMNLDLFHPFGKFTKMKIGLQMTSKTSKIYLGK